MCWGVSCIWLSWQPRSMIHHNVVDTSDWLNWQTTAPIQFILKVNHLTSWARSTDILKFCRVLHIWYLKIPWFVMILPFFPPIKMTINSGIHHVHVYTCIYIYINMYIYIYISTYVIIGMLICIQICIYTYNIFVLFIYVFIFMSLYFIFYSFMYLFVYEFMYV